MNNLSKFLITSEIGSDFLNRYIGSPFKFPSKTNSETLLFRFASVSDTHFGLNDHRYPIDGLYQNRMQLVIDNLIREKKNRGLDFFIGNGDIVHSESTDFGSPNEMLIEVLDNYFDNVGVPYYITAGNHDRINDNDWIDIVGEHRHTSFEFGDFGFIVADSSDTSGSRQICLNDTFIENKLNEFSDKKGVFFFSHIPRFRSDFHPEENAKSPQCEHIMELIGETDNVILMSSGHFHEWDNIVTNTGIDVPLFFNGHVSNYGVNYYGYRIFEVYEDKVITKQFDMTNQIVVNEHTINY